MLKLAGEFIEGQLADHMARLDAHTLNCLEGYKVGAYFPPLPIQNWGNFALGADKILSTFCVIARDLTVDRIAVEIIVAASAGKKARLGIYNIGADFTGGSLLLDAGEIDIDSIGIKAININQALPKNFYVLSIVLEEAATIQGYKPAVSYLGMRATDFSYNDTGLYGTHTYGSLQDPHPAASAKRPSPLICLRLASLD